MYDTVCRNFFRKQSEIQKDLKDKTVEFLDASLKIMVIKILSKTNLDTKIYDGTTIRKGKVRQFGYKKYPSIYLTDFAEIS